MFSVDHLNTAPALACQGSQKPRNQTYYKFGAVGFTKTAFHIRNHQLAMEMELSMLPFTVDTWNKNSRKKPCHFLTHAHKDHSQQISAYASYPIYCSPLTKRLVLQHYPSMEEKLFVEMEIGEPIVIANVSRPFTVTAYDANHCPGAIMLLFEGDFGNILHTGDCRLTADCLAQLPRKFTVKGNSAHKDSLDCVFLDCTFGNEPLKIPSKRGAIMQIINCIWKHPGCSLIYLACDLLGQEEILLEISKTFGCKIFVDKSCLTEYHAALSLIQPDLITDDPSCRFHVCEGFPRLYDKAQAKFKEAEMKGQPKPLFIRPSTQWYSCEDRCEGAVDFFSVPRRSKRSVPKEAEKDQYGVWHICYSMHSSKSELEEALDIMVPKVVISTTPNCRAGELNYVRNMANKCESRFLNKLNLHSRSSRTIIETAPASENCTIKAPPLIDKAETMNSTKPKTTDVCISSEADLQFSSPKKSIPLFGRARHCLPQSPPLLFNDDEDSLATIVCDIDSRGSAIVSHAPVQDTVDRNLLSDENKPLQSNNLVTSEFTDQSNICLSINLNSDTVSCAQSDGGVREESTCKQSLANVESIETIYFQEADVRISKTVDEGRIRKAGTNVSETPEIKENEEGLEEQKPRVLHESIRRMYRSLRVPVPRPLPSLLDQGKFNKRSKFW